MYSLLIGIGLVHTKNLMIFGVHNQRTVLGHFHKNIYQQP